MTARSWAAQVRLARTWGRANGYQGRAGGWIYDSQGRAVVQGWTALYRRFATVIEREAGS